MHFLEVVSLPLFLLALGDDEWESIVGKNHPLSVLSFQPLRLMSHLRLTRGSRKRFAFGFPEVSRRRDLNIALSLTEGDKPSATLPNGVH